MALAAKRSSLATTRAVLISSLLLFPSAVRAQTTPPAKPSAAEQAALEALPHYEPKQQITGTIRLWGHGAPLLDFMGMLVKNWQDGFAKFQPGIKFEYDMYGTASAMGALYADKGDLAILGQDIYPFETTAFETVKHYPPSEVRIATGSVDIRNFGFALGVFVNQRNPLAHMTLDQINKAFAWHEGGPANNITTWGQLGLTGDWADKPIHLYGWYQSDIFSTWIEKDALHGSHKWRCSMKRYAHIKRPDGTVYDSGQQILEDLGDDPYGLALSNVRYLPMMRNPGTVKPLDLGRSSSGPFYATTKSTLINQEYPLVITIPAVYNRTPGKPVDPAVKEFLLYLLSREGQQDIVNNGKYLPLNPAFATQQRELLK